VNKSSDFCRKLRRQTTFLEAIGLVVPEHLVVVLVVRAFGDLRGEVRLDLRERGAPGEVPWCPADLVQFAQVVAQAWVRLLHRVREQREQRRLVVAHGNGDLQLDLFVLAPALESSRCLLVEVAAVGIGGAFREGLWLLNHVLRVLGQVGHARWQLAVHRVGEAVLCDALDKGVKVDLHLVWLRACARKAGRGVVLLALALVRVILWHVADRLVRLVSLGEVGPGPSCVLQSLIESGGCLCAVQSVRLE
jgi:hypothetical protein